MSEWKTQHITATVIHADPEVAVSTVTLEPEKVDLYSPPEVVGLGRFIGGQKHGIRKHVSSFEPGDREWRVSVYQYLYAQGTVITQRLEVKL